MRFGRKQQGDEANRSEAKKQARHKIWEDPTIIEEVFNDAEWERYDVKGQESVPSQKMRQHVSEAIDLEEQNVRKRALYLRRSNRIMQVGMAAALLLFISFQLWQESQPARAPQQLHYAQQDTTARATQPVWVSMINDSEYVDTLLLPDRSTVHLFAHSRIRYLTDFSKQAREIHLEGKAYFAVEKDTTRPFSVYVRGVKTTALGTSFTIDTRVQQQHTSIELHTGKVVVVSTADIPAFKNIFLDRKGANLQLDADMRILRHQRGVVEKAEKAAPKITTGNLLHLENIPLPDVFVALQEAYQQPIHVKDSLIKKIQYTGVVDSESEDLVDVLTVICLINDLRYEEEEDGTYSIYRQEEIKTDSTSATQDQ